MRNSPILLAVLLLLVFALAACEGSDSDTGDEDGDVNDGDVADGDTPDGDDPPDGDSLDGDLPPDGDEPDGDLEDGDITDGDGETDDEEIPDPGVRLREEGWLRGDLHMHTKWSDGMDPTAMIIAISEYLENEDFLAVHPEYVGNGLDFISITDHRTVDVLSDPDWVSERLILVPGEEFGSDGHANLFGITEFVSHDPDNNGTTLDDILAAVDTVHGMDAVFSINHPMAPGDPWPWDTRTHDALEVWNTKWAMGAAPFPEETITQWEQRGPASPMFKRALMDEQDQVLRFYEAMLARGVHVALVGGSDRHVLFMIGFPTTWIKPTGPGSAGLVDGIRLRQTFVSRTPVAATVEMTVEVEEGESFMLGEAIQIPPAGTDVRITVRVGRAEGGLLRIIRGASVETDEDLAEAELGTVLAEVAIDSPDFTADFNQVTVLPGEWIYPIVLESLHAPGLTDEKKEAVDKIATAAVKIGSENYGAFASLFLDYIDIQLIIDPAACDVADWDPDKLQCIPLSINDTPTSTFFVPDWIDRGLNAVPEEDGSAIWCMGAIGSAVRFIE